MGNIFDDPVRVEQMARAFEGLTRNVGRLADRFKESGKDGEKVIHDFHTSGDRAFDELEDKGEKTAKGLTSAFKAFTRDIREDFSRVSKGLGDAFMGHGGSGGGAMAGLTGPRGAVSVLGLQAQSLMRTMPVGGLLGMMVYGRTKDLEYDAAANKLGRTFDKIGGIGQRNVSNLSAQLRTFNVELGSTGAEIEAGASALAQYGISDDAFSRATIAVDRFGGSILATTVAQDQLFNMAAGTSGKLIGEVYQDTGESAGEAADEVLRLGMVSSKTHMNMEQMMSTMSTGVTTLRLQRQGVDDLASSLLKIRSGFDSSPAFKGMNKQAKDHAAMEGLTGVAQGLTSLPLGLQETLGRAMGGGSGIHAIMGFQEGTTGNGAQLGKAIEAIRSTLLPRLGHDRDTQMFGLQQLMPGLGLRGAQAVVDYKPGGAGALDKLADAIKDPQEKLREEMAGYSKDLMKGFDRQYSEQSEFAKTMTKLLDGMAHVGSGLFGVVTVGLTSIITHLRALGPSIKMAFGKDLTKEEQGYVNKSIQANHAMDAALGETWGGLSQMFGATGAAAGAMSPEVMAYLKSAFTPDVDEEAAARKRERDAQDAEDLAREQHNRALAKNLVMGGHVHATPSAANPDTNQMMLEAMATGRATKGTDADKMLAMSEMLTKRFGVRVDDQHFHIDVVVTPNVGAATTTPGDPGH